MENIKTLLGSSYKEGMTVEEINKALEGKKLVDLSTGEYVSKAKYDSLETKHKNLQSELDQVKEQTKDYETLKTENETFKTEKANADLKSKFAKYGIKESAFKYVKGDIDAKEFELGDDEKVNQANVKKYLESHPEFANDSKPVITKTVGTSVTGGNGSGEDKNAFNDKIHQAFSK